MRRKRKDKFIFYLKAYNNTLQAYSNEVVNGITPYLNKVVFYGVKALGTMPESEKGRYFNEVLENIQFAEIVMQLAGLLTPREFMNIFPIEKTYDGDKYGTKDYFYTMEYIKTLDIDEPIGNNIDEFLWNYTNWDITFFVVNLMGYMSGFRRLQGKPSLAEEWAHMNGIDTYTKHTDSQGKEYLYNNTTGKTVSVSKERPKHLKLIK